jgi:four helix bundle protein
MNSDRGVPWDIRERAFDYGLRAIKLFRYLEDKRDRVGWIVAKQYLRAATSIGANLEEALHGESRADFIHKYGIAQKEARESLYWLRLLTESATLPRDRLRPLMKETEEIILIITTIILRAKRKPLQKVEEKGSSIKDQG